MHGVNLQFVRLVAEGLDGLRRFAKMIGDRVIQDVSHEI